MAEIALGAVTLLREVFLLSKFVAQTARSASRHQTEREALQAELDYEHLYIRSFGLLFFRVNGQFVEHDGLNREWLEKVAWILDGLRLAFADYAKLAGEKDDEYRQKSPFLNTALQTQPDSGLQLSDLFSNTGTFISTQAITSPQHPEDQDHKYRPSPSVAFDWKWALFEKKKLGQIVDSSRKWTHKLKELVQLTMVANPRFGTLSSTRLLQETGAEEARILGVSTHLRVREVNLDPLSIEGDNSLSLDARLDFPAHTTTLCLAQMNDDGATCDVLVETKEMSTKSRPEEERRVKQLAALLSVAGDSDLSTLSFKGYKFEPSRGTFAFVFDFPPDRLRSAPTSLHDIISRPRSVWSGLTLSQRFYVAQSISKSLVSMHAAKWVHKSFRSHSIVFFKRLDSTVDYRSPYLTNFEYSRATSSITQWTSDEDDEKNLYRHPDRQLPPQKSFNQIHDLYALGMVLLELGTWSTIAKIKNSLQERVGKDTFLNPETLADYYADVAERELPHHMGPAYAEAVLLCIRGNFGFSPNDQEFPLRVYDLVIKQLDPSNLVE
ncbi:hypothetical protein SLS54_001499 [Diplodia seriata]|uniref:Protein kinase domain-containing protein n=1 Tax=Diplodia seriata TaxID=420778 RepID=A0A1S8BAF3_9PEZI|nr:hypothetical protein BK809_0001655 [Diplodia seriata]